MEMATSQLESKMPMTQQMAHERISPLPGCTELVLMDEVLRRHLQAWARQPSNLCSYPTQVPISLSSTTPPLRAPCGHKILLPSPVSQGRLYSPSKARMPIVLRLSARRRASG